jgi:hypothetical protein
MWKNNSVGQESQTEIVHWPSVACNFEIYSGPRVVLSNKEGK